MQAVFDLKGNSSSFTRAVMSGIGSLTKFTRGVLYTEKQVQGLNRTVTVAGGMKKFSAGLRRATRSTFRLAKGIARLQTNMLGIDVILRGFRGIKSVITSFTTLEEGMFKIKAVTGATGPELQSLRAIIDELGLATQFTTKDIANAVFTLGTMGVKGVAAFEKLMPSIANAATSLDLDMNRAAEIVLSTMRTFNMEISESARVVDILTNMYTNSSMSAEKWAVAQQYAGLAAKTFERSLEDVLPLLMALSDQGIEASIAGTQIRTGFLNLLAPTGAAKKALDEMGLSLDDINVKEQGFIGVLKNLENAQMNNTQALVIFGKRAMPIISALLKIQKEGKKGVGVLDDYQKALMKTGEGARQAKERQQGLSFAIKRLDASFDQLKITVGETLEKWFDFSGTTEKITQELGDMSKVIKAVDFGDLKTAAIEIFDPTEIAQNIENAFEHVLPAALDLLGSAGLFGASVFIETMKEHLPGIMGAMGRSFLAVIIDALSYFSDLLLGLAEGLREILHMDTSEIKEYRKESAATMKAFSKEVSGKPAIDFDLEKMQEKYEELKKAFSKVPTKKQVTSAKEFVSGIQENMRKNKVREAQRTRREQHEETLAKRAEMEEFRHTFPEGPYRVPTKREKMPLRREHVEAMGIAVPRSAPGWGKQRGLPAGTFDRQGQEDAPSTLFLNLSLLNKVWKRMLGDQAQKQAFLAEGRGVALGIAGPGAIAEMAAREPAVRGMGGIGGAAAQKAQQQVEDAAWERKMTLRSLEIQKRSKIETQESFQDQRQDNRNQVHHNYRAGSKMAGKVEKGKTRTPQGDSV